MISAFLQRIPMEGSETRTGFHAGLAACLAAQASDASRLRTRWARPSADAPRPGRPSRARTGAPRAARPRGRRERGADGATLLAQVAVRLSGMRASSGGFVFRRGGFRRQSPVRFLKTPLHQARLRGLGFGDSWTSACADSCHLDSGGSRNSVGATSFIRGDAGLGWPPLPGCG